MCDNEILKMYEQNSNLRPWNSKNKQIKYWVVVKGCKWNSNFRSWTAKNTQTKYYSVATKSWNFQTKKSFTTKYWKCTDANII